MGVTLLCPVQARPSRMALCHRQVLSAPGKKQIFPRERGDGAVAIKIYRIQSGEFYHDEFLYHWRPSFTNVKKAKKELIFAWTKRSLQNLARAKEAGLPVPEPLVFDRNILIMEFLGENERPYPQLRNVELEDPAQVYATVVSMIDTLYKKAELVHGGLKRVQYIVP